MVNNEWLQVYVWAISRPLALPHFVSWLRSSSALIFLGYTGMRAGVIGVIMTLNKIFRQISLITVSTCVPYKGNQISPINDDQHGLIGYSAYLCHCQSFLLMHCLPSPELGKWHSNLWHYADPLLRNLKIVGGHAAVSRTASRRCWVWQGRSWDLQSRYRESHLWLDLVLSSMFLMSYCFAIICLLIGYVLAHELLAASCTTVRSCSEAVLALRHRRTSRWKGRVDWQGAQEPEGRQGQRDSSFEKGAAPWLHMFL